MRRLLACATLLVLAACATMPDRPGQRYVVFFQEWSAQLDAAATGAISGAADRALRHPDQPVIVTGFADTQGTPQANREISQLRAQRVLDSLVADGVPAARIRRRAMGAMPSAETTQESRRVDITVGTP